MLQLTLSSAREHYRAGELPLLTYRITNVSNKTITYWSYLLDYRLKASMVADNQGSGPSFELQPFQAQPWPTNGPEDILTLDAGEYREAPLSWHDAYGFGFVARHSQPPVIPKTYIIKGFPAGSYRFSVYLSDKIGYYAGKDQVFDRQLVSRVHHDRSQAPVLEAELTLNFNKA